MDRIGKIYRKIVRLRPSGFWPGFIIGLIYFSYIFGWFWSLYPLDTLGVANRFLGFLLILFVFMLTVACASLFWGLFSFFSTRLTKGSAKEYLTPFFLASIFVLAEYLRSWGIGIVWIGSGSFLGPHWTLGNPAYLLSFLPWLLRTSSVWGIYGIDFIIIFSLSALVLATSKNSHEKKILLGEILIILVSLFAVNNISFSKQEGTPLTFSIIQTNKITKIDYSLDELLNDFSQKNVMLKNAAKNSDIIVFPETANFSQILSEFFNPAMAQKYFNNLSPNNILIVDSNRILESSGLKSKVIFIDSKNGVIGSYDKKLLTPGGEFLPYIFKIPLSIFGFSQKNNLDLSEFTSGSGSNIIAYQNNNIKVLVCSDIISPSLAREGAFDFILGLNSMGIFRGNKQIEGQAGTLAQFRAVENGKYLVMASNYGRSYLVNPQGNIMESTSSNGYQILTGSVVPNKTRTWYNKLGDLPILLLSLAIFGLYFKNYLYAKQD